MASSGLTAGAAAGLTAGLAALGAAGLLRDRGQFLKHGHQAAQDDGHSGAGGGLLGLEGHAALHADALDNAQGHAQVHALLGVVPDVLLVQEGVLNGEVGVQVIVGEGAEEAVHEHAHLFAADGVVGGKAVVAHALDQAVGLGPGGAGGEVIVGLDVGEGGGLLGLLIDAQHLGGALHDGDEHAAGHGLVGHELSLIVSGEEFPVGDLLDGGLGPVALDVGELGGGGGGGQQACGHGGGQQAAGKSLHKKFLSEWAQDMHMHILRPTLAV